PACLRPHPTRSARTTLATRRRKCASGLRSVLHLGCHNFSILRIQGQEFFLAFFLSSRTPQDPSTALGISAAASRSPAGRDRSRPQGASNLRHSAALVQNDWLALSSSGLMDSSSHDVLLVGGGGAGLR